SAGVGLIALLRRRGNAFFSAQCRLAAALQSAGELMRLAGNERGAELSYPGPAEGCGAAVGRA
ncbi:MAG TPA: hypothetical protein PLD59_04585, partial [Tepidisphaeraceae bacterium]|nr:hypothetical protein [Tepidisphaeraceae bacterium]